MPSHCKIKAILDWNGCDRVCMRQRLPLSPMASAIFLSLSLDGRQERRFMWPLVPCEVRARSCRGPVRVPWSYQLGPTGPLGCIVLPDPRETALWTADLWFSSVGSPVMNKITKVDVLYPWRRPQCRSNPFALTISLSKIYLVCPPHKIRLKPQHRK